jgi:ribosomal protein L27
MATVTPNFNWPVPTSTDLVKDGATAIEALGDSIDASLLDLKGGTTGQILAKTTNTDMDFTWITNDVGDITGVTAGTGLTGGGTSGAVTLAVDPTYAGFTNLNYQSNPVLNSSMNVWQRGTTFSVSTAVGYGADRWYYYVEPAGTVSRQNTNDTTNLPNIQYCQRVQRNVGNTSLGRTTIAQSFETVNSYPFIGKTITLSFYARKGANFSGASSNMVVGAQTGTGTDQNIVSGYSGSSNFINSTATLTTTWQRFTFNGTPSSSGTEIGIYFEWNGVGTAGAADYFEITGVQIDLGSVALPFRSNGPTYEAELAACQRYYQASASAIVYIPLNYGTGYRYGVQYPVTMRIAPTVGVTGYTGGGAQVVSEFISTTGFQTGANGPGSGPYFTQYTASAEL